MEKQMSFEFYLTNFVISKYAMLEDDETTEEKVQRFINTPDLKKQHTEGFKKWAAGFCDIRNIADQANTYTFISCIDDTFTYSKQPK